MALFSIEKFCVDPKKRHFGEQINHLVGIAVIEDRDD